MQVETVQLFRGQECAIVNKDDAQDWIAKGWGENREIPAVNVDPAKTESAEDVKRPRSKPRKP